MTLFSERNKKVALSRWQKIHNQQKAIIDNSSNGLLKKAILCGFLAGDGNIHIRKEVSNYEVRFFPDDDEMLAIYFEVIQSIYGQTPSIFLKNNYYYLRLTSKIVVKDICNYADFGLYSWTLPHSLFQSDEAKILWLKAFFSAEAYVGPRSIKVQTVNLPAMKEVSNLLLDLGIENKYYEFNPKQKAWSKVGIVFINKKKARKLFYEKIGFWHEKKNIALLRSLNL
jgi:hypothetical protein